MAKLLLLIIFLIFFSTLFFEPTFSKKSQKPSSIQYAEPRLQAAIKRSEVVLSNFTALLDRAYDRFPGFFEEVIPRVETYQQEVKLLREAYQAWTENNTAPMENLMWHLPGMVFDLEEGGEQVLASSFVQTATTRIAAQEKSIRHEMTLINRLIQAEETLNNQNFTVTELLNLTSAYLRFPLQEAIKKINFTSASGRPSAENATDDQFVDVIFEVAGMEEQLTGLLELEAKVNLFWNSLIRLWRQLGGEQAKLTKFEVKSQRFRYLEMVVGKAVIKANRTFTKVVKGDRKAMKAFEAYVRGN